MRILKSHPLLKLANSYIIDSSEPSNISYLWNFGSLLGVCLIIQIITGVLLAMHYSPNVLEAFNSIEHIMRDVNNGWLIRYFHSNTASAFFTLTYLHIGRGMYYSSYRSPRTLTWAIGTVILILLMATGFLGYVLPYGQMSLWGATVITNMISAIPWIGQDVVEFIWGGFSVNNATLNRFFALHFLLPFILAALVIMHLIAFHDTAGSSNPLGLSGNYDRLPFAPYFVFKDLITIFILIFVLSAFVFFMSNILGDSENYIMANPMQTPAAIVPEWYLLPFYAILRSIPNKLLGVIAMFSALLIIMLLPITDLGRSKGLQFRPLSKISFFIFVANFLVLLLLGSKHVESPFIQFGQISTALYFAYFIIILPGVSIIENTFTDLSSFSSLNTKISNLKSAFDPSIILTLANNSSQHLVDAYNMFSTINMNFTILEGIAKQENFACAYDLIDTVKGWTNDAYTGPSKQIVTEMFKQNDLLSADAQTNLARGLRYYTELKNTSGFSNLNFEVKSQILTELTKAQSIGTKAILNLSGKNFF
jgi:ubiquinol-cytochrome c reductase cytochrome b subunit